MIGRQVTDSECSAYERDGVAYLPNIFDLQWINFLSEAFKEALISPGPLAEEYTLEEKSGRFFADLNMWQRLTPFKKFVFESPAANIARSSFSIIVGL